MTTALLVVAIVTAAVFWLNRRPFDALQLGLPERIWFHLIVTWPIVFKGSIGQYLVGPQASETSRVLIISYVPGVAASLFLVTTWLRKHVSVYQPATPTLLLMLFYLASAPFNHAIGSTGLAVAMMMPMFVAPRRRIAVSSWAPLARASLVAVTASTALAALADPADLITWCRADKCTHFGVVLNSPLTGNGNFLGVAVTLLMPFAMMDLGRLHRVAILTAAVVFVDASGSRSALAVAVACGLVTCIFPARDSVAVFASRAGVAVALVCGVYLALKPMDPMSFTTRSALWIQARQLWRKSPIFGWGPSYWTHQIRTQEFFANYGTHNIILELLVSGGLVAAVAFGATVILVERSLGPGDKVNFNLIIFFIIALGCLESPLQLGELGISPACSVIPIAIAAAASRQTKAKGRAEAADAFSLGVAEATAR